MDLVKVPLVAIKIIKMQLVVSFFCFLFYSLSPYDALYVIPGVVSSADQRRALPGDREYGPGAPRVEAQVD